jgi:hypothetical protein
MKWSTTAGAFALASMIMAGAVWAADETAQNIQVKNRFRVGWDSNVYEVDQDETDSFKFIEEVEILLNFDLDQTFFGARYRPTFIWWSERDPDDTDFHHEADLVFSHNFTPRLSLSAKDTLRIAELPELIDRGVVTREKDDYIYNLLDGVLGYKLSDPTRMEIGARHTLLRYDDDAVAETDDYDIYAAGITLRRQLQRETAVSGEARVEQTDYVDADNRSSDSLYVGAGWEQIFTPGLVGSLRGGWQQKQFDDEEVDDETAPYLDVSVTFLPSPKTRLSLGAGYSMFEADITQYANQERTLTFLTLSHDLTARIQLFLATSYQLSTYDLRQEVDPGDGSDALAEQDGDENIFQASARASYMVNRRNYVEASVQYLDFQSDLRNEFDRTRLELGWRTQL